MKSVKEAYRSKPAWVSREIKKSEVQAIHREIRRSGATSALEIGVASGFSSAMIMAALAGNTENPILYSYDISERCYFDNSHRTGDAYFEIIDSEYHSNFHLTTGVISAGISNPGQTIDFAFIDADHRNPWPALDLIAIWHFLSADATIALHDLEMPFLSKWRDTNGGRDLFRAWSGGKRRYDDSLNIGFLRKIDEDDMVASVAAALRMDWERHINLGDLAKYDEAIGRFSEGNQAIFRAAIKDRQASARAKTIRPVKERVPSATADVATATDRPLLNI